jgi:hypothetical protein
VIRRRASQALVLFLVALAVPLAGCRVQSGAAYFFGDERISTTEVEEQVADVLDDEEFGEQLRERAGQVRQRVVLTGVALRIYRGIAEAEDIQVDTGRIDLAVEELSGAPRPNWPEEIQLVTPDLAAEFLVYREAVTNAVVTEAGQEGANAAFTEMVNTQLADHPVTVNPRYGQFDPEQITLVEPKNPAVKDRELPAEQPQPAAP